MPGRSAKSSKKTSHDILGIEYYLDNSTPGFRGGTTIDGVTYYDDFVPFPRALLVSETDSKKYPYHLPPPPPGSKPPASWDEWERNSNWPLPPNIPKDLYTEGGRLKLFPTKEDQEKKAALQDEQERNSNWPFPARKGTSSQSAQPAPAPAPAPAAARSRMRSNSKPRERKQSDPKANAQPAASTSTSKNQDSYASYYARLDPYAVKVCPLLAENSIGLVRFDLRLPYTLARKQVRGGNWTHLNHEDLKQPACTPHRTQMRIYTHITGGTWTADVRPRKFPYITVQDVLMQVCETFSVPVDHQRWARDRLERALADRLSRAYARRVEKYESSRIQGYKTVRQAGLLRVDYLGSKYMFDGLFLCYGADTSEWYMMKTIAE